MTQHVFLTGEKHIGKSTLLKKVLDQYEGKIGGFRTIRTDEFMGDSYSVHMLRMDEAVIADADNLLFICGRQSVHIAERFNDLGCRALSACTDCSLLVMDELGPHEADAALFHDAVLQQLDGDIPILGVLQAPAAAFWLDIVKHPRVHLLELTEENREQEDILDAIYFYLKKEK